MKGGLATALAHFSTWAGGVSKRVAVLMGFVGGTFTFLSIAFGYWTSQQKFFTQKQGDIMLDTLARIESNQRAEAMTREGIQKHDREQDDELKEHDRAIVRLDALKRPGTKTFKAEEIRGRAANE